LFFLTLKSVSGKSWSALEREYRKDSGLPTLERSVRLQKFMVYAGGTHVPSPRDGTADAVAWALLRFPETTAARHTVLFQLLTPHRQRPRPTGFRPYPTDSKLELLRRVSPVVLDAAASAPLPTTCDELSLPQHRLLQALDVVATIDHLDALTVLLVGVKKAQGLAAVVERSLLCRQWLRRWTSAHPELCRSHSHLWASLHLEMPQLGPLDGEFGIGAGMDVEQESALIRRCCGATC
jgi:hypothetical protein